MHYTKKGFTLPELMTVIVVIGVLAAMTIVAYNGMRSRAQAAALADGLTMLDDSLRLWAIKDGLTIWPMDPITGGGTPFTELKTTFPTYGNYLTTPPTVQGIQTEDWFYDNDGDSKTNCTDPYDGVNIVVRYVTDTAVATMLDKQLDDGNLTCGKVRYVDQRIFYTISNTQSVYP